MSIKGKVQIDKYEAVYVDGEWVPIKLVETIEKDNRISPSLIDFMRVYNSTGRTDMVTHVSEGMFLGANVFDAGPGAVGTFNWVSATIANAATYNVGVEGGADSYWEIQSTVNPTGAGNGDRNIRTIVLTSQNNSYDNRIWTIVNLPTPCVQGENEILQITYRLINDQSAIAALGTVNYAVSEYMFRYNVHGSNTRYSPTFQYLLHYDDQIWGKGVPRWHHPRMGVGSASGTSEIYYDILDRDYDVDHVATGLHRARTQWQLGGSNVSTAPTIYSGMPFKGVGMGNDDAWTGVARIVQNQTSRVQNIFGRIASTAATDRVPFLDNDLIATSGANIDVIDKGDWYDHRSDAYFFPYAYRIKIITGGNVGTATYKLRRRRITHYVRNAANAGNYRGFSYGLNFYHCGLVNGAINEEYLDVTTADTRKHGQTNWHTRAHSSNTNTTNYNATGSGDAGTMFQRYIWPEFITFDYDGLTVGSVQAHDWTNLDANSTQAQTFIEILQVSTDGADIYVADASQGLYQVARDPGDFNTSNWTVNKIGPPGITDDTSCRGVFHKGGTYWGGPGKIVDVNVVRAGSNYAVGDAISVSGANGTSFAAEVGRVDADGGIEAVTITNRGSGYIEDHCQLYVSAGNGVGASLDPIIGAGGEMWAIFNDTTDSVCYMAKMTHVLPVSATNFNLDTTADTITRTGGDWVADGFRAGQVLWIKSAENAANEGRYTIASVDSATQITLNENITTTNATDTQAQIYAESWEVMRETVNTGAVSFTYNENSPSADTITRGAGSFITDGFVEGMKIDVTGTASNDGTYTIASVAALTLTLDDNDDLAAETVSSTIYAETDFTITNYTSGTPGPANIIGLVMDQEHVDDRFAILTASTKAVNDGVTNQSVSNWTWWSHSGSKRKYATFDTNTGVDGSGEVITTAAAHGFADGQEVTYSQNGGSSNVGLTDATQYFVNPITSTTLSLHTSRANAMSDTSRVDLTSAAAETHLLTADQGTDFTAVTGNGNSTALTGEHIGTHCVGPLSDGNNWVVHGLAYNASGSVNFHDTTITGQTQQVMCRYFPHRCKTNFDIGIIGEGQENNRNLKSNRVLSTDFTTTTSDSIIVPQVDDDTDSNTVRLRPGYWGGDEIGMWGYFGHGMGMGRLSNDSNILGGYIWNLGNGDGSVESEDLLPYGFWEEYGWDGTRWVLDNASARTTHAQVSFSGTSLNINATTGAIIGSGGGFTDWATDGFEVGDIITLTDPDNATNDGQYVVESLSGTTLTVTPDKLPAVTDTATAGTVLGDHAIIDGMALSFDDVSQTAPLVLNEYYDFYLYDGILKDNATSGTLDIYAPYAPTKTGTDFESTTIPNSDVGQVFNEPITLRYKSGGQGPAGSDVGAYTYQEEPGILGGVCYSNTVDFVGFSEQQIPASTDFTMRFKVAQGSDLGPIIDVGVAPYSLSSDGSNYNDTVIDYNARVQRDYTTYPTHDQYSIIIRNTGSGTVQHTESADRVVLVEAQDETVYDGGPSEGTFIGGLGTASDNHEIGDNITMNDGTIVAVNNVDGNGTITEFTVTTNSTSSSGNGQIGSVSSTAGASDVSFSTTGNTITRGSGSFVTDGFRIGMKIAITGAATAGNNGAWTIKSVTALVITTEENLAATEASQTVTIDHAIVQVSTDGTGGGSGGINFALIPGANNLQPADVGNDEYALCRRGTTGDNLYWTLNGVEFYTHTGGPFNDQYNPCFSTQAYESVNVYDWNLDYTVDRRYLKIGNGTNTGADDPNFRTLPNVWAGSGNLRLYYNSGGGPVEFTYVTDGATAPASGEVTILPYSGKLWFNTAQAGNTLTGNWTICLKPNIE